MLNLARFWLKATRSDCIHLIWNCTIHMCLDQWLRPERELLCTLYNCIWLSEDSSCNRVFSNWICGLVCTVQLYITLWFQIFETQTEQQKRKDLPLIYRCVFGENWPGQLLKRDLTYVNMCWNPWIADRKRITFLHLTLPQWGSCNEMVERVAPERSILMENGSLLDGWMGGLTCSGWATHGCATNDGN